MGHSSFKTTQLYISIREDDFYNVKNPLSQYYNNNNNKKKSIS